jgi:RNase P/RNase MRP subunit POP5
MMRKKRRYIAFESMGEASAADIIQAINSLCADRPMLSQSVRLVLYDEGSKKGLLRCDHNRVGEIKALISGVEKAGTETMSLKVLGVSGTIKAAKRKFLASRGAKD